MYPAHHLSTEMKGKKTTKVSESTPKNTIQAYPKM